METREELIKGLHYTKDMITKILAVQKEQVGIVAQYREEEQGIATTGLKNRALIWLTVAAAAAILFHLVHGALTGEFYSLIWLLFTGGMAFRGWKKGKRGKKLWTFLAVADGVVMPFVYYWRYLGFWLTVIPAGIVAAFAIRYAIRKKNEKAQTEINNSLKQQTLNQEKINKQLQYANVLNIASLFLQAGTQAAVDANTRAVMDNTDVAKNLYNRMY